LPQAGKEQQNIFFLQMGESLKFQMFTHLIFSLLTSAMTEVFGLCFILHRDSSFQSSIHLMISCSKERKVEWKKERERKVHLHKGLTLLAVVLLQWMTAVKDDKEGMLVW